MAPLPPDELEPDPRYRAALDWIWSFSATPVAPSATALRRSAKLERMAALLAALDNPHHRLRTVLVAGTKGKGSTVALAASAWQDAGVRVGRYTSPHLVNWRERTWIDGQPISTEEVLALVPALRAAVARVPPSLGSLTTFEVGTALSLLHFARQAVQIAVVEVGVGGANDATNVLDPLASIITPISYDHQATLGASLESIAAHKAGILRPGRPAIVGRQPPIAAEVIERAAHQLDCRLIRVGVEWDYRPCPTPASPTASLPRADNRAAVPRGPKLVQRADKPRADNHSAVPGGSKLVQPVATPPCGENRACFLSPEGERMEATVGLLGWHQLDNATAALAAIQEVGRACPDLLVPPHAVQSGFARVDWPGRLQVVHTTPIVVLDGAHNAASARVLRQALEACFPDCRLHLVLAMTDGKDADGILSALAPLASSLALTRSLHERAMHPAAIASHARTLGLSTPMSVVDDPHAAFDQALRHAGPDDVVLITGSLFLVGEALTAFQGLPA